jgi:hypothetical protein
MAVALLFAGGGRHASEGGISSHQRTAQRAPTERVSRDDQEKAAIDAHLDSAHAAETALWRELSDLADDPNQSPAKRAEYANRRDEARARMDQLLHALK